MTISLSNVDWGENIRGFPFPIISVPYTHNSSSIPNIYLGSHGKITSKKVKIKSAWALFICIIHTYILPV